MTSGMGGSSAGNSSGSGGIAGGSGGSGNIGAVGGALGEGGSDQGDSGGGNVGGKGGASGDDGAAGAAGQAVAGSGAVGEAGMGGGGGQTDDGEGGTGPGGAGGGSSGAVGVLGTECSSPGALACAGNHQKLTVLCGGDGRWAPNVTCGAGDFCDSTPGENAGTCRPELPECADGPGTTFCADEKYFVTCSADTVSTSTVACDGACRDGVCREASECPVWEDYDRGVACSLDCGDPGYECLIESDGCVLARVGFSSQVRRVVVRTSWAGDSCDTCGGPDKKMQLLMTGSSTFGYRVTVPEPWGAADVDCTVPSGCLISQSGIARIIAGSPDDGPVNIVVEALDAPGSCP